MHRRSSRYWPQFQPQVSLPLILSCCMSMAVVFLLGDSAGYFPTANVAVLRSFLSERKRFYSIGGLRRCLRFAETCSEIRSRRDFCGTG